jgi:NADPH:quinone reductase-like Zn-dependent oxidoreductase
MSMRALVASGDDILVKPADVPVPDPAPHEAVLGVEAFSPNRGEIVLLLAGRTDGHGKDVAGRIAAAAADGSGPPVGARVVAHLEHGGWAEQVAVATDRLVPVPDAVSLVTAAALPLAGLTALRLLRALGDVDRKTVLLTGASGGLGHAFVELAGEQGARVTAVTRSGERGARLAELGADRVVQTLADVEPGFDFALESVGGELTGEAFAKLRRGGLLLWYGQASRRPAELDLGATAGGPVEATLRSFFYWTQADRDPADLATLVDAVAEGRLHPEIGLQADWSETAAVLAAVRNREVRGNAVVTIEA